MGNVEIFEHLDKLDKYLQDEDAVMKMLYHAPSFKQGLGVIAEGLFSSNVEIEKLSAKIL